MNEKRPKARVTPRMLRALTCPRRFEIEYCHNYRLKGRRPRPWPPSLKTLLHAALRERDLATSAHQRFGAPDPLRAKIAVESVLRVYQDQLKKVRGATSPDEARRSDGEIDDLVDDARRILAHYDNVHEGNHTFAEDRQRRPMVDCFAEFPLAGSGWTYTDRIDGVMLRGELPPAVLMRRFTSTVDPGEVQRGLALDPGLVGTMWCATKLLDRPVTVAVVDVVRTKPPSIPETVRCQKCHGSGINKPGKDEEAGGRCGACAGSGIGGMSKKPCDTTLDIWNALATRLGLRIAEQRSRCEQTVQRLEERGESFAHRVVVEVPRVALDQWERDVVATADLIGYYTKKKYWPRNPVACIGRSGPCPYRKACSHHGTDDVAWFTEVDDPYPGLD